MIVVKGLSYSSEDPSHLLRILDPSIKNFFLKKHMSKRWSPVFAKFYVET